MLGSMRLRCRPDVVKVAKGNCEELSGPKPAIATHAEPRRKSQQFGTCLLSGALHKVSKNLIQSMGKRFL